VLPISQADLRNFVEHNLFGAAKELSDQVVLNPPVPNQMGAFWAKQSNELPSWMLEVNYRINGPDRGGKGLAVWYTKSTTRLAQLCMTVNMQIEGRVGTYMVVQIIGMVLAYS
jgi:hypothetical protein